MLFVLVSTYSRQQRLWCYSAVFYLMSWSIFWSVIIFSCFIFSYFGFPVVFLSALVEIIGDLNDFIKHKREIFAFFTWEKKHKNGRNCWRTQSTLLSKLLIFFSRRFIHSGVFSYPSLYWHRIPICDLTSEVDKLCGIFNIFSI